MSGGWTRVGECNGCGWCCRVIASVSIDLSGEDPEWLKARGVPGGQLRHLPVIAPCPQLEATDITAHGDLEPRALYSCKVHATKPAKCAEFPQHPAEIAGSPCSYTFVHADGRTWPPQEPST